MFSIQRNFACATELCAKEKFYDIVGSQAVASIILACRKAAGEGNKKEYDRWKRKLPAFIFMSEVMPNEGPDGKGEKLPLDRWRKQHACRLNGLTPLPSGFDALNLALPYTPLLCVPIYSSDPSESQLLFAR